MVRVFNVKFERANILSSGNVYHVVAENARQAINKALDLEGNNSFNVHRIESVQLVVEAQ